jgi:phosphonate transport system permease protein
LIRTFPEILFCMILVQVTGVGPVTGVVVLSFQSVGMIGKMYSDDLDSMNTSFLESLDASGATTLSKIRVGVFPQVFSNFISTVLYRFDLNLRNAAILGIVGAGDMGRLILSYSSDQNWPQLGALLWGLLVMVLIVDAISTAIRKKLV